MEMKADLPEMDRTMTFDGGIEPAEQDVINAWARRRCVSEGRGHVSTYDPLLQFFRFEHLAPRLPGPVTLTLEQ